MFGKNEVTSPFRKTNGDLLVHSILYTIQGEGPDAGKPAVFIRLAKCNLRCTFCDTEFEKGAIIMPVREICRSVQYLTSTNNCRLVVITGGEPFLQNFTALAAELNFNGICVSVETAGTLWDGSYLMFAANRLNKIICSPKTPQLAPGIDDNVFAWKYIIAVGRVSPDDGLPIGSTQPIKQDVHVIYRPDKNLHGGPIYVQAMDEQDPVQNQANLELAAHVAMKYGYRLSVQMHKYAKLP